MSRNFLLATWKISRQVRLIDVICIYFSIEENNTTCTIRIDGVEEEDQETWVCQLKYQNKDGESVEWVQKWDLHVANFSDENPTLEDHVVDENTTETNFM